MNDRSGCVRAPGCRLTGKMTGDVDQVSYCASAITLDSTSVIALGGSSTGGVGVGAGGGAGGLSLARNLRICALIQLLVRGAFNTQRNMLELQLGRASSSAHT